MKFSTSSSQLGDIRSKLVLQYETYDYGDKMFDTDFFLSVKKLI